MLLACMFTSTLVQGSCAVVHRRTSISYPSTGDETTLRSRIDEIRQTLNETRLDRSNGIFDGTGHANLHHTSSTTAANRGQTTLYGRQGHGIQRRVSVYVEGRPRASGPQRIFFLPP
jgi:hypothetical protein